MEVRTRFAPSPTGDLHVGGLRTALYNYVFAKQNNGSFILRIEDTDQKRLIKNATSKLINSLKYFNLIIDEGPKNGDYGPYKQSERLDIYKNYYLELIQNKKAYVCVKNNEGLIAEYDINKALNIINNKEFVIKLRIPTNEKLITFDKIRGEIEFDLRLIDDPIIIKSDGFPTYHFANVIDDHLMKISHVIRGEEWLPSLPKHILLYKCFNWDPPNFIHLPLLLNTDKSKLSKRQGDVNVDDFLNKGYLRDVIINFIALLGWNPKNDNEIFSISELIENFSIKNIQKSGAIFDIKKLNWMNSTYIKNLNEQSFLKYSKNFFPENYLDTVTPDTLSKIVSFIKERIIKLDEISEYLKPFERDLIIDNKEVLKVINSKESKTLFEFWINNLLKLKYINKNDIDGLIRLTTDKLFLKGKDVFFPLRGVLFGKFHGPDLYTIISILGKEETIFRLKKYLV